MVDQLRKYSTNIHIIDNMSNFPPLLDYLTKLEKEGVVTVHRMNKNYGHRVFEIDEARQIIPELNSEKYVITDPDLILNPNIPTNFIDILSTLSDTYKTSKIGLALDLEDNINLNKKQDGRTIKEVESEFWNEDMRIKENTDYILYRAAIDTTFALINKNYHKFGKLDNSIRVAGPFTAIHRTWQNDWEKDLMPGELDAYNKNNVSTTIHSWKTN